MALCVQCQKKEAAAQFRPFCSKRCADLDLHAWFNGNYAVPVVENDGDFDDAFEEVEKLDKP